MRAIPKGREPASLVQYRATPEADYEGYRDKDTLRDCLVREQRGLCCYCLSRIRAEWGSVKIEHWRSQASYPAEQLNYSNLLAACMGGEGAGRKGQHCDTRKGDRRLSRNPADPVHRVEDVVRFPGDGRITSTDTAFDTELNEVLNLNLPLLISNRKAVMEGFLKGLEQKAGRRTPEELQKYLQRWNGELDDRVLQPFCQVVVYYLRKRLARAR